MIVHTWGRSRSLPRFTQNVPGKNRNRHMHSSLVSINAKAFASVPWYETLPLLALHVCMIFSFGTSDIPQFMFFMFFSENGTSEYGLDCLVKSCWLRIQELRKTYEISASCSIDENDACQCLFFSWGKHLAPFSLLRNAVQCRRCSH